jgi:hypothetical protein
LAKRSRSLRRRGVDSVREPSASERTRTRSYVASGRETKPAERRSSIWRSVVDRGWEARTVVRASGWEAMLGGARRRVRPDEEPLTAPLEVALLKETGEKSRSSAVSMVTKEGAIVGDWLA